MEGDLADRHGIGANNPPSPIEELTLSLTTANADLDKRSREIDAAKARLPTEDLDDERAGKLTEFVKQCQAALRTAKDRHDEAKRPYLDMGKAVDNFFAVFSTRITDAKSAAERLLTVYAQRKREAQRKRDEEIAKAYEKFGEQPPPPTEAPVRVRSDYGGVATQTERWTHEIEDLGKIPLASLRAFIGRDAIDKAIRAYIRHHHKLTPDQIPPLKGVKIFQAEKVTVR